MTPYGADNMICLAMCYPYETPSGADKNVGWVFYPNSSTHTRPHPQAVAEHFLVNKLRMGFRGQRLVDELTIS